MGSKPRQTSRNAPPPQTEVTRILEVLKRTWGHATCELDFQTPFQLLIATILSAQSTDKRVNLVTPVLFREFPDARALAAADPGRVEEIVHSTGFYRQKTRSIIGAAHALVSHHEGEVPRDLPSLVKLPGVARKTANVVLGSALGIPSGVVVDTHVKRVSARLGLTTETDPVKVERDLMDLVPTEGWIDVAHQLIWHGRRICHARNPACDDCPVLPLCPGAGA